MLLWLIKCAHSMIIGYMMLCLYFVWEYALTGFRRRFTVWAFLSIVAEGIVFIAWGWDCPLTIWAQQLGDTSGADLVSEMLYLEQVQYTNNFALFFLVGCLWAVRHHIRLGVSEQKR